MFSPNRDRIAKQRRARAAVPGRGAHVARLVRAGVLKAGPARLRVVFATGEASKVYDLVPHDDGEVLIESSWPTLREWLEAMPSVNVKGAWRSVETLTARDAWVPLADLRKGAGDKRAFDECVTDPLASVPALCATGLDISAEHLARVIREVNETLAARLLEAAAPRRPTPTAADIRRQNRDSRAARRRSRPSWAGEVEAEGTAAGLDVARRRDGAGTAASGGFEF